MEPIFSVIVPIYKVEKTLRRTVDSLLRQTFHDFEILLIDDGSPDNCPSICDEYAQIDNRIKVIHKENGGLSSVRNCGIRAASGTYVLFVDGDDYVKEDLIAELTRMQQDYQYDLLIHGADCEKANGDFEQLQTSSGVFTEYIKDSVLALSFPGMYFSSNGYCRIPPTTWDKAYKKEIILKNGLLFDETLRKAEDYLFNISYVSFCSSIRSINKCLYVYCYNQDSIMRHYNAPFELGIDKSIYIVSQIDQKLSAQNIRREEYWNYLSQTLIRMVIDNNEQIVMHIPKRSEQKMHIRNINSWFEKYLDKYGLTIAQASGTKFRFERFIVKHRMIGLQIAYAKAMKLYHRK